ncbi:NIPSNAP family protein [Neolewinella lacunae]|uniref:NIPSNAP family protein n=1 Tax=Neolewinella lacunae TaxID=1517758 RepID=A0A923PMF4_9BACT|nr:NIPSNAP family protein [Neolewinella lacunae]MBC6993873.1 NIPSNAP family protein [Neolewinella lacunae]MDN3637066.1 NIPSNAP family protein [Neolewinella lacunae]
MQRRNFLAASAAALPFALGASPLAPNTAAADRQLLELRTYEIKFGGSGQALLLDYLKNALAPALQRLGCADFRTMKELGNEEPAKLWGLISYPNADTYLRAQDLSQDATYQAAASGYTAVPAEKPIFSRYSSQLLHAFTGMPQVQDPGDAGLFELRTYEGYSEDAVRRKIKMFNDEEFPLFYKVGLLPVFFGEMISGPYRPSLVYMLHFKDMEERNANWQVFIAHPEWKAMSAKAEYANSVSNIRKTFLLPA